MITRKGFVSNSSSSSFILAFKQEDDEEINYEKKQRDIIELIGIPSSFILQCFVSEFTSWMIVHSSDITRKENWQEGYYEKGRNEIQELLDSGWRVFTGEAESYGDGYIAEFLAKYQPVLANDKTIIRFESY